MINLRLLSNYFRNIEDFIDNLLLGKIGIKHKDISVKIEYLIPDKDFASIFLERKFLSEFLFSIFTLSTSVYLTYLRYSKDGKYSESDILIFVALTNFGLFLNSSRSLLKYRGKPWIKK